MFGVEYQKDYRLFIRPEAVMAVQIPNDMKSGKPGFIYMNADGSAVADQPASADKEG